MTANILFERIFTEQKKQCGPPWIIIHNPFKLTSLEVQKQLSTERFTDMKTLAIRFASRDEGKRQARLYFLRLLNKGGNLADFFLRIDKQQSEKIVNSLTPFYKFKITIKTNVRELCDE